MYKEKESRALEILTKEEGIPCVTRPVRRRPRQKSIR